MRNGQLLAEAEPALARFRELGKVHELLTEGTTMIEAGFDAKQVDATVERALQRLGRVEEEIAAAIAREVEALARGGGASPRAELAADAGRDVPLARSAS